MSKCLYSDVCILSVVGPAPYQHGFPPHQGYYPMHALPPQPAHPASQSMTYSPYPPCRESAAYSHPHTHSHPGSAYSSQPPPSYHRSYTPTSSRSGKSLHSGGSNVKQGQPIHLWGQRSYPATIGHTPRSPVGQGSHCTQEEVMWSKVNLYTCEVRGHTQLA